MATTYTTSHTVTGILDSLSLLFMKIRSENEHPSTLAALGVEAKPDEFKLFGLNVATITLMAATVEGALTHLVSTELMGEEDPSDLTKNQRLFQEFLRDKIELEGGWSKTGNFYLMAFEQSIQNVIGSDLNATIRHLFSLRNSTAHGTSIVYPNGEILDNLKDYYPYSWQRRMKQCNDYLDAELPNTAGLPEHLRSGEIASHFWSGIQEISEKFLDAHSNHSGTRFFAQIASLAFGYRWNAPRKR